MITDRRKLITGLISLVAMPAVVRASSLDLVRGVPLRLFPAKVIFATHNIYGHSIERMRINADWSISIESIPLTEFFIKAAP